MPVLITNLCVFVPFCVLILLVFLVQQSILSDFVTGVYCLSLICFLVLLSPRWSIGESPPAAFGVVCVR